MPASAGIGFPLPHLFDEVMHLRLGEPGPGAKFNARASGQT
jgi:hypothetical protein